MDLTVAICTWNRARLLKGTLEGMMALEIPQEISWEILVVDNRSPDNTEEVVRSFQDRLPVQYLFEGQQGKTHAANLAVSQAMGEAIIWTDDDVRVDPRWLVAYAEAMEEFPEAGIFGGPITPQFEGAPPAWLLQAREMIGPVYAELKLDSGEAPFDAEHYPYGANMAIRKELHDQVPFDTRVGRRGRSLMGASETVLIRDLLSRGITGRWVPGAGVDHIIPEDRQTLSYIRRFFFGAGQVLSLNEAPGPKLFGKPRWVWRQALQAEVLYRITRPWAKPERWLKHLSDSGFARGMIRGSHR